MRAADLTWMGALCAAATLLLVSTGYAQQGNPGGTAGATKLAKEKPSGDNELDKAPNKWRARHNPMEQDPDAVAAGKKLFRMHCAECHGETAEGTRHAPNLHDAEVQEAPRVPFSGSSRMGSCDTACRSGPNYPNRNAGSWSRSSSL